MAFVNNFGAVLQLPSRSPFALTPPVGFQHSVEDVAFIRMAKPQTTTSSLGSWCLLVFGELALRSKCPKVVSPIVAPPFSRKSVVSTIWCVQHDLKRHPIWTRSPEEAVLK